MIQMLGPLLLYHLMKFLQDPNDNDYLNGTLLLTGMLFFQYVSFLLSEHAQVYCEIQGYKAQIALVGMITQKTLKTTPSASEDFSQGEIINRLSTDTSNLKQFFQQVAKLLSILITLILGFAGIFNLLGLSILSGAVPLVLLIIANIIVGIKISSLEKKLMAVQDNRLEATTQTMQNIKTIKMAGWEPHFKQEINRPRARQIKLMKKQYVYEIIEESLFGIAPAILTGTIFCTFVLTGNDLTPSIVYTMMLIFQLVKGQIFELPIIIGQFIETYISMNRIEQYLLVEEVDSKFVYNRPTDPFKFALEIQNASFTWRTSKSQVKDDRE